MSMQPVEAPARALSRILHDPLPGTGYRAVRRLGGGMIAEVFEAIAPSRARCAVKVLRSVYVDRPDAVFRMTQEARTLVELAHPSIVPVIDAGTTGAGRPFFAMPLLEGETAKSALARRGRLSPAEACAIAVDALEGLDAAHRAGIVHRDVKPGNLFLPEKKAGARKCVVIDFGVAKVQGSPRGPTTGAAVIGTPRYLAPEQILGGRVDGRTDVYALGLTLFELIAGRGPFDVIAPMDLMRAHLDAAPRSLRELAGVSHELEHAVLRAIAKSPGRRWPTARAFAAVLARAAEIEIAREAAR
jgi:serine/threonine-protein kinase